MTTKILLIENQGQIQRIPLEKSLYVLGRDPKSDIVLDDKDISRKHAQILYKFGSVYIENSSSVGTVEKNGQPVEYVELLEKESVRIGPFTLSWEIAESEAAAPVVRSSAEVAPTEESNFVPPVPEVLQSGPEDSSNENGNPEPENAPDAVASPSFEIAVIEGAEPQVEGSFEAPSPDAKTQVFAAKFNAALKVIKGEEEVREIRLEGRDDWVVGRSPKCDVHIKNQKLSRQHFRVFREGSAFKVQDLGSANGTRVNGVSVSEVVLKTFDTIQAGPVELQFLIVDQKLEGVSRLPSPSEPTQAGFEAPEATIAAVPVPYDIQQNAGQQARQAQFAGAGSATASGIGFSRPQNTRQTYSVASAPSKPEKVSLQDRFNALPPAKKAIYASAVLGILAVLALQGLGTSPTSAPDIATATPQAETTSDSRQPAAVSSGALSSDISPEFSTLSADKQKEIETLYSQAEAAKTAGDWQKAFDSSKAILGYVKQFKNTKEILEEAQTFLNEKKLGLVTQSMSSAAEAEEENQERVRLLLESGRKALAESRFQDAIDAFTRASVLDPANTEALQGLAASQAQDKDFKVNIPSGTSVGQADPALESILALNQELEALRTQYLEARNQINNGVPGVALNLLTELESKIQLKSSQIEAENRSPAAVPTIQAELGDLRIKVIEGIDVAKAQLRSEYQSQLADAQEFAANRQYAQAREIYDRILKAEKSFTDVLQERKKLYDRMISEARNIYQEALIYEAMGDMDLAIDGYRRARDLMVNVEDAEALEYYRKAANKLQRHFTK